MKLIRAAILSWVAVASVTVGAQGLSPPERTWSGWVQTDAAYTWPSPAHWSKLRARAELTGRGAIGPGLKWKLSARAGSVVFVPSEIRNKLSSYEYDAPTNGVTTLLTAAVAGLPHMAPISKPSVQRVLRVARAGNAAGLPLPPMLFLDSNIVIHFRNNSDN